MKLKLMLFVLVVTVAISLPGMAESRTVVFVTGDDEYHSREIMLPFAKKLEDDYGFTVVYLADEAPGADTDSDHDPKPTPLEGVEAIEDADLVVLYVRFRNWDEASMKIFMNYFDSGKPGIAFRTTTHAFWNDRTFSPEYFGGHYKTHYTRGLVAQVDPDNTDHPMARGVPRKFSAEEGPYVSTPMSEGVTPVVLAYGHNRRSGEVGNDSYDSPNYPVAWAYDHKGARRAMITLGSDRVEDEESAMMQGLFYNAVFWALGDEVPAGGVLAAGDDFEGVKETRAYETPKHNYPAPPAFTAKNGWEMLFDGSDLSQWKHYDVSIPPYGIHLDERAASEGPIDYTKSPARWKIEDGAAVARVGYGDIVTKAAYSEYELRLDFLVPDAPDWVTGEWRGNSGVYLNGSFEIAISDTHGKEPSDRSNGAIYRETAPKSEASKPAGQWQTLEVTFKGGKATVVLSGETIHKDVSLSEPTPYGFEDTESGPIRLQAESSSVRFANIAIKPL